MQLGLAHPDLTNAKLPTNLTTGRHPVHRWFNFIAGFSPEFVAHCIGQAPKAADGFLLDPFAGTGTALLEAQLCGLPALGYEPHPFFADMARAKLAPDVKIQDVDHLGDVIRDAMNHPVAPHSVWPDKPLAYLEKLVPARSLAALASCVSLPDNVPARLQSTLRLMVSRILEGACGSQTDGIYKAPTSLKRARPVIAMLDLICDEMRTDLRVVGQRAPFARVIESSAAGGIPAGASLCVTSPPYLNNFDFAEMTRMELYFWRWAHSWAEITLKVRRQLLVNTTTAPKELRGGPDQFRDSMPSAMFHGAHEIYSELAAACAGRAKDYHRLVFPYFGGLQQVLTNVFGSLQDGAPIHVIVADSALYGIHIPLHDFVALGLQAVGFEDVQIQHLRQRGDRWVLAKRKGPPGKLGEYWVTATH